MVDSRELLRQEADLEGLKEEYVFTRTVAVRQTIAVRAYDEEDAKRRVLSGQGIVQIQRPDDSDRAWVNERKY